MGLTDYQREVLAEIARRRGETKARWCPENPEPKQAEFLALSHLEALYGGAAGGGKSSALLMGALEDVDQGDYAALVLRRTYADLALPGAIMDRSHEWLANTAASWNGTEKTWSFPSGARLTFGYLDTEKDKFRYQSSEFQYVAFDELTQFSETQYTYLLSRLRRRTGSALRVRARSASNPGGVGHDWVKRRFVEKATRGERAFVPATLNDNPHVDAEQYRLSLAQLDETTRQQLEHGVWIRDAGGLVYKYNPDKNLVVEVPQLTGWQYVLAIDFGASEREPTTALAVLGFTPHEAIAYLLESSKHAGLTPSTIAEHVVALEQQYGRFVEMVGDQGALGKGYIKELRTRHELPMQGAEKQNKLGYRKLFNGDLEHGRTKVVAETNDAWIEEANTLTWNAEGLDNEKGQPNHATDAALYGWRAVRHYLHQPAEKLPEVGSKAYYDRQAEEMKKRAAASIKPGRARDFLEKL